MDTDEVVPVSALRPWLCCLVESAWQATGYRRIKNPRIWSLHDLAVLTEDRGPTVGVLAATRTDRGLDSPTTGQWCPIVHAGSSAPEGTLLGYLDRAGARVAVAAPAGPSGLITSVRPVGFVDFGADLVTLGTAAADVVATKDRNQDVEGVPDGVTVVLSDTDGTFFARPEPDAPKFVDVGTEVHARATLGLIEVMKTFNPVRSPIAGVLAKVCVGDGDGVESGQVLFWVRSSTE